MLQFQSYSTAPVWGWDQLNCQGFRESHAGHQTGPIFLNLGSFWGFMVRISWVHSFPSALCQAPANPWKFSRTFSRRENSTDVLSKGQRQWHEGGCGMASLKSHLYTLAAGVTSNITSAGLQPLLAWLQQKIPCKHLSLKRKYWKI